MRSPKTFCTVVTPWLYKKSFEFFIFTPRLPTYNQNRFRHISLFWCFTTVNQNWKSQLKIFAIYIWKFSWKFIVSLKIDGSIFRIIQFYCWLACFACFVHLIFSSFGFWYFNHFSCVIFFPFFSVLPILPCKM